MGNSTLPSNLDGKVELFSTEYWTEEMTSLSTTVTRGEETVKVSNVNTS